MTTRTNLIETLDAIIAERSLLKHPFYQAWNEGTLPIEKLREYAKQYFHFEAAFPTFLSAIHSRCESAAVRQSLLENLWDEEFGPDNHVALWLRFCEGLGLSEDEVAQQHAQRRDPGAGRWLPLGLLHEVRVAEGLAAMYAYESQAPEVARQKIVGLARNYGISGRAHGLVLQGPPGSGRRPRRRRARGRRWPPYAATARRRRSRRRCASRPTVFGSSSTEPTALRRGRLRNLGTWEPANLMAQESGTFRFKNLELWRTAQKLAIDICKLCDELPSRRSADVISRQLIRSATSVPANIAEGHGRFSLPAYLNHLSIAKGSATESQGWLDMLAGLGHIAEGTALEYDRRCDALIAAITRRILTLEQQRGTRQVRDHAAEYRVDSSEVPRSPGSQVQDDEGEVLP